MGPCNSTNIKANRPIRIRIENSRRTFNPTKSDYLLSDDLSNKLKITRKYSISTEYLGKGSSGVVSEATDKNGKKYAIKCINKLIFNNVANITSEVEISLLLNHEHIIKCYEVYEDLKTISFVMELIEGGDLLDYITKSPIHHLTDDISIELIIQILETIKYLHVENKIAHRDIKPENFLVVFDRFQKPKIKLIDFGFACFVPQSGTMDDFLGSPIYTAPEILKKEKYDMKVDIWSTGIVLFNMLTGYQPFSAEKEEDLDNEELTKDINFSVIPNEELRELCMMMLEKDPKRRANVEEALNFAKKIKRDMSSPRSSGSGSKLNLNAEEK